jgi:hypothetical protein
MKTNFNWGDNTIDSRDIIAKHEELQDEFDSLVEDLNNAKEDFEDFLKLADEELKEDNEDFEYRCKSFRDAIEDAQESLDQFNQSFDKDELDTLTEIISQGEDSSDWSHGETLIKESYFTQYIEELVNDCYEMPSEFTDGKWPWTHMSMNWEEAADEAKADYNEICVDGETYLIR